MEGNSQTTTNTWGVPSTRKYLDTIPCISDIYLEEVMTVYIRNELSSVGKEAGSQVI